jgi:hypothetical protein
LLFASATPGLTPDQQGTVEQLFEYDAVTGELVRLTKGEDGYNDNGNGVTVGLNPETIAEVAERLGRSTDFKAETNQLNVSRDGKTVVFRTEGRLSPYAASGEKCFSVYEFHASGSLSTGEVHLLSGGRDTSTIPGNGCGNLLYPGGLMDASGDNVLFSTTESLVPGDTDGGQRDLYDARVGGGFALPRGALCSGEGCGAAASGGGVPGFVGEGSAVQASEAPLVAAVQGASGSGGGQPGARARSGGVSRSVLLARALRACRAKPRVRRLMCERGARRRYGPVKGSKASSGGGVGVGVGKFDGGSVR